MPELVPEPAATVTMMQELWPWVAFNAFVLVMLALDLGVFHRKVHTVKIKEALYWSVFWIALSMLFAVGIFIWHPRGSEAGVEFLNGYALEKMLSVDNLFVFVLIFSYFKVPKDLQHTVLFWGIIGALFMRAAFIVVGKIAIEAFGDWVLAAFGLFLVYTGIKLARNDETEIHPESNPVLNLFRKFLPVTKDYHGKRFLVRDAGKLAATPLLMVLLMVETTDVIFAVDSIPAIFGITHDTFIVYTSNVFAILGLRALFFALAGIMPMFRFLNYGLCIILVFIGIKMLVHHWFPIPAGVSLSLLVTILIVSVAASMKYPGRSAIEVPGLDFPGDELPEEAASVSTANVAAPKSSPLLKSDYFVNPPGGSE